MKKLAITPDLEKDQVIDLVENYLKELGFSIETSDKNRPWGGFFVLKESQILKFRDTFFPSVFFSEEQLSQKLSPKFLIVAPGARLSWQYHHRRSELWTLVSGGASVSRSMSDSQNPAVFMENGVVISLERGERHRLVGTDVWGIVAEIWMHSDSAFPSNEADIVRLDDDYSRN